MDGTVDIIIPGCGCYHYLPVVRFLLPPASKRKFEHQPKHHKHWNDR